MANFKDTSEEINIINFKGLKQDTVTGDTQLELNESPDMLNFKITKDYKLQKREGFRSLFDKLNSPIQGMYYCKLGGKHHFVFSCGGKLKEYDLSDKTVADIGDIEDYPINFFYMKDKLYMLNGHSYKSYDGTTLKDVEGTIPEVVRGASPSGGGVSLDQINALTGKRKAFYSSNGTDTVYHLPEKDLKNVIEIRVDNVVVTSGFTLQLPAGTITFNSAPTKGVENVEITYEVKTNNRTFVTNCTHSMLFGGNNDTRVFIWGDVDDKNSRKRSAVFDPEYFPVNNFDLIGSDETAITDIVRVNDRQIIFKESSAFYSYYQQTEINGILTATFPTYNLNGVMGNVAPGQTQIIRESPFTLDHGVQYWVSTQIRDERDVVYKSGRVKPTLDFAELEKAITFDYQLQKEYWVCIGSDVWIYNYDNDTWYKYNNINATCFIVVNDNMMFGTPDGEINLFNKEYTGDNLQPIQIYWKSGFSNLGVETKVKYLAETWLTMKPEVHSRIYFTWRTNKKSDNNKYLCTYSFANFDDVDFSDFSFETNYNPQAFHKKTKAKKFAYIQFILEDTSETHHATINEINVRVRVGGKLK